MSTPIKELASRAMAVVHNPLIPTDVRIVVGQLLTILADLNERVSKLEGERHAERGSTR